MYYIVTEKRLSWGKFLVKADDKEEAIGNYPNSNYLGEVDATDTEIEVAAGPFENEEDALGSIEANVV